MKTGKTTPKKRHVRKTGEHLMADCGGFPRCVTCGADEDEVYIAGVECTYTRGKKKKSED